MDLEPGSIVASRYRLDKLLGEGGMGLVWAATHTITRKPFALKFLKSTQPEWQARFRREARAASAVRHANVVQVHDVIESDEGATVMVMELLVGESLGQRLAREGRLPVDEVARILLPAVSAVGTAHAMGIVHRDLKPDNIFLAKQPDGSTLVKVLDFGIAKLTATEGDAALTAGLTGTGTLMGTPFYMSPEQGFGEKDIDHRADVWSLGIILYQCCSGILPTRADNMGQIYKILLQTGIPPLRETGVEIPEEMCALVDRMLARVRDDRARDLREVLAALERLSHVEVPSFGAAVPVRPITGADTPQALALAPTTPQSSAAATPQDLAIDGSSSPAGVERPSTASSASASPAKWSRIGIAGGGVVVVLAALALLRTTMGAREEPQGAEGSAPTVAAEVTLHPDMAPTDTPAPAAPSPAAGPSATPTASAAATSRPLKPGPGAPTAAPTARPTVTPVATATAAPEASGRKKGVIEQVPF